MELTITGPLIIAGDFNARGMKWSMQTTDSRRRIILDVGSRLQLIVANRIGATTPDIAPISEQLFHKLES